MKKRELHDSCQRNRVTGDLNDRNQEEHNNNAQGHAIQRPDTAQKSAIVGGHHLHTKLSHKRGKNE